MDVVLHNEQKPSMRIDYGTFLGRLYSIAPALRIQKGQLYWHQETARYEPFHKGWPKLAPYCSMLQ